MREPSTAGGAGRHAVVVHLASGRRATYSKRGRVDWCRPSEAASLADRAAARLFRDPIGYALPCYDLFGPKSALGHVDPVVRAEAVPESRWNPADHHTLPHAVRS